MALDDAGIKGCKPKIGMFHFMFQVETPSPSMTLPTLEVINNLGWTWPDPRDPTNISTIRCQTDKSPVEKHANKVYGELRKQLEAYIKHDESLKAMDLQVKTSGPRGPLYIETTGDSYELCTMYRDKITDDITWKTMASCLEAFKLTAEVVKEMQDKAVAAANKWE